MVQGESWRAKAGFRISIYQAFIGRFWLLNAHGYPISDLLYVNYGLH